jgi:hypothetical protein
MAVLLLLLAFIGGGVVADLVLENTTGGEVTVLNQTVTGHTLGTLLAMAAALGLVIGLLLVASMGSTKARRARRRQLRSIRAGMQHQVAQSYGEQAGPLDAMFSPREPAGELGEPAGPADLGTTRWAPEQPDGQQPQFRHDDTRRAVHPRDDPDRWFGPSNQRGQ